ncbi:MAG: hypothetical protein HQL97_14005 [Magnetococcales bacterium]|nr:hypothetical protein [Magnetococcales bacterium]
MHLEILVEGQTELTVLSMLMPRIIGPYQQPHTWKIHKHRGIGSLPEDPSARPNWLDTSLLHNLPSRLTSGTVGKRSRIVLEQKRIWARRIVPEMDVERNRSGSFHCFRDGLRRLTA